MNQPAEQTIGNKPRILVVEDHILEQKLLMQLALKCGFEVQVASSSEEAISALANGSTFSLILMDWKLPGIDGLACTKHIRDLEKEKGFHTPVVAITGRALEGDRNKCLVAGMDDYMAKPFTMEEFRQMLSRWVPESGKLRRH
jgi:CheY-like chemotaxis protein